MFRFLRVGHNSQLWGAAASVAKVARGTSRVARAANFSTTTKYVIKFDAHPSSASPYGQDGTYPIKSASFAYGERGYNDFSDTKGHINMDTSYFTAWDPLEMTTSADVAVELDHYLLTAVTSTFTTKPTVTILELTPPSNDSSTNYNINKMVVHADALIGKNQGVFMIVSNSAILSTIEPSSGSCTYQTTLDFKNRQVNGK